MQIATALSVASSHYQAICKVLAIEIIGRCTVVVNLKFVTNVNRKHVFVTTFVTDIRKLLSEGSLLLNSSIAKL